MATTSYAATFADNNSEGRLTGQLTLTDSAAVLPTDFALLNQLTSALTVTSGALPQLAAAWVSGTAKVNPVARQIVIPLAITGTRQKNPRRGRLPLAPATRRIRPGQRSAFAPPFTIRA